MKHRIHSVVLKDNELNIKGNNMIFATDGLVIARGGELSSYTYFGALSVGKWKKYTTISDCGLYIRAKGRFNLKIWHVYNNSASLTDSRDCIYGRNVDTDIFQDICIEVPMHVEGLVYFTISDISEESYIEEAYYYTEEESVNDVRLAINICTYKRDEYLARNVEILKVEQLADTEIFITDNASQIQADRFNDEKIHLVHNKNLGGAGGFTRGLCEILRHNDLCGVDTGTDDELDGRFTHVLFMDDDVTIEPESIRRTIALLSYLRTEYLSFFVAGAMLREEQPYIQHENGAVWNAGKCKFVGRGIDLREESELLSNEEDYERDYAAWWYCCMPMSTISYDNLPIPIFVHEDDVEYSLRNARGFITLNGICVWHPSSPHRRPSINYYYNLRNMLIVNSKYCGEYGAAKAIKQVITALVVSLMRHRYKDMKLIRRAVIDFLAGPDYLMSVDQVWLHQSIVDMGYRFVDISDEVNGSIEDSSDRGFKVQWSEASSVYKKLALIFQLISLNGWLLPRKKKTEVHYMNEHPVNLYRAGRLVLFDDKDNKGIVSDKEFFRLFELLGFSLELWIRLLIGHKRAVRIYNEKWDEITSVKCWSCIFEEKVYE